ncbi:MULTISPECIES: hypothetical protein [Xanthomonas]|nr:MULTISPECIES: hypothetical protein [Xanthomonas]
MLARLGSCSAMLAASGSDGRRAKTLTLKQWMAEDVTAVSSEGI